MNEEKTEPVRADGEKRDVSMPRYDDEISLFDLYAVLVRRRWAMAAVVVLVLLIGGWYALAKPTVYGYSASIDLGAIPTQGGTLLTPTPEVLARVRGKYLPAARRMVGNRADVAEPGEVEATAQEAADGSVANSGVIGLRAQTTQANGEAVKAVMEQTAESLVKSQEASCQGARSRLKVTIKQREQQIATLRTDIESSRAEVDRLTQRRKSLADQQSAMRQESQTLREQRRQRDADASGFLLMSLNADIASLRSEMNRLRELRNVTIPQRIQQARSDQRAAQTKVQSLQAELANARNQLQRFRPARLTSAPERSPKPVGTGAATILALTLVLAVMLAVFAAFAWEFLTKAHAYNRDAQANR